ncbi:MAG: hypothetical protein D6725_08890 [Planctomycetota bacterium]|nr:MAG: hypothetical protein D6725_08890 [Planctomycetota bacterium]
MTDSRTPAVVLITDDLTITTHVQALSEQRGWSFLVVRPETLSAQSDTLSDARMVVVDLGCSAVTPQVLRSVIDAAGRGPATVAFGPHVHGERLQAARELGFRHVLPRGRFLSTAAALFEQVAGAREP